jgi:hypothetical protein
MYLTIVNYLRDATVSLPACSKERAQRAISETGTGFADAKLSEILPPLALLGSSG